MYIKAIDSYLKKKDNLGKFLETGSALLCCGLKLEMKTFYLNFSEKKK